MRWAQRIAADRPHVLIYPEIGMDPMTARLAASRRAPVQYASWGHPSTTGYPSIDFFLSSDRMEPANGQAHYTERLVRLPGLSTPFSLQPYTGEITPRRALGLSQDATVYWCAQSLAKYLPQYDRVFAEIAARVPNSQFIFVTPPGRSHLTTPLKARLTEAFAYGGLSADEHCVWLPALPASEFTAAMGCADIVLDSIGWSGCNTLLEAFRHGLPVVTLPGETMRSRHGAALLETLGIESLICADRARYVEVAATLAEPAIRTPIAQTLSRNLERLFDLSTVRALETHMINAVSEAFAQTRS